MTVLHFSTQSMWIMPRASHKTVATILLGVRSKLASFGVDSPAKTHCFDYYFVRVACLTTQNTPSKLLHEPNCLDHLICLGLWLRNPMHFQCSIDQVHIVDFFNCFRCSYLNWPSRRFDVAFACRTSFVYMKCMILIRFRTLN